MTSKNPRSANVSEDPTKYTLGEFSFRTYDNFIWTCVGIVFILKLETKSTQLTLLCSTLSTDRALYCPRWLDVSHFYKRRNTAPKNCYFIFIWLIILIWPLPLPLPQYSSEIQKRNENCVNKLTTHLYKCNGLNNKSIQKGSSFII